MNILTIQNLYIKIIKIVLCSFNDFKTTIEDKDPYTT